MKNLKIIMKIISEMTLDEEAPHYEEVTECDHERPQWKDAKTLVQKRWEDEETLKNLFYLSRYMINTGLGLIHQPSNWGALQFQWGG